MAVVVSGTGLFTPAESISNEELVRSYNQYVKQFNEQNINEIEAGKIPALEESSVEFVEKASGIQNRFVINKSGVLDPNRMAPHIAERSDEEDSIQCEISVKAITEALRRANKSAADVDAVIVACSNMQRPYPAIAIEIQNRIGAGGYAYDMNVACSSATFAIQAAADAIHNGSARSVLVVNPEICSGHLEFRDRDCHFIFGDVCTALLLEDEDQCQSSAAFRILGSKLKTQFSNNIRNNFGFLNRCDEAGIGQRDKLFNQNGRKVFKEVCPMVAELISQHLAETNIPVSEINRLWLHQANFSMNQLIAKKVLGRDPVAGEAPNILDQYANTSSAGAIIAFHKFCDGLNPGDKGVICSFGAGYSVGSILLEKC